MKMKELRELLDEHADGYIDDAEVVVVDRSDPCVNRYYPIRGLVSTFFTPCLVCTLLDVQDWGTRFEIVITKEV